MPPFTEIAVQQPLLEAIAQLREDLTSPERLIRAVAAGRRRGYDLPWRRVELRYIDVKSGRVLQITYYDDKPHARTRNALLVHDTEHAVDDLLHLPFANWHIDTIDRVVQLRVTKKGYAQLHAKPRAVAKSVNRKHDRQKPRLLPESAAVLQALGIADHRGQIKPSRQAKYRQVDEFLGLLEPAIDRAIEIGRIPKPTPERPLRVVDLGCGNAYLTFAAASYLATVRNLPLEMVGVDARGEVTRRNTTLARRLGFQQLLTFIESRIDTAHLDQPPDVVLSLHACDTATDEALARAIRWESPIIMAAPCCHHDIQTQLSQAAADEPYTMITRYGILRERFADVLTDALRASILRQHGYRRDTIQFVGTKHTRATSCCELPAPVPRLQRASNASTSP